MGITRFLLLGLAALAALTVLLAGVAGVLQKSPGASADPNPIDLVAIDMMNDVVATNEEDSGGAGTGAANCGDAADNDGDTLTDGDDPDCWENNEDSVGPVNGCAAIPNVGTPGDATVAPGTDLWFDLVVKGVPSADLIRLYQFDIDYDPAIIEIIGAIAIDGTPSSALPDGDISILSRIDSYGGAGFSSVGTETAWPTIPDGDGSYTSVGSDGTGIPAFPAMHEPTDQAGVDDDNNGVVDDAGEGSPDGVLARIRIRGIGAGMSQLIIPSVLGGADGNPDSIVCNKNCTPYTIASMQSGAVIVGSDPPASDADSDCISDSADNCPDDPNPGQEDGDGDQWGDACDNCAGTTNPGQENADGDQWGDTCDVCTNDSSNDTDNDGICMGNGFLPPKTGDNDNCPDTANPGQENNDGDSMGDACDPDDDNDGWLDGDDDCPFVATAWAVPVGDSDCDGFIDTDEGIIGTDPADNCANTSDPNDEADDRWPSDFDDNQVINVLDYGEVLPPVFASSPGAPDTNGDTIPDWSQRADLVPDGVINVLDVGMTLPPYFGYMCT